MITGLQGYTVVRNAFSGDYCLRECVESMLACCEKVLVCDADSTDGTLEFLQRWCDQEPRLSVVNYPWPNPKGDGKFFVKWLNYARERLTLPMQLELDADEVLDDSPECHARLREAVEKRQSLLCDRLNYWRDASHLIPEGHAVGRRVVRVGPSEWWMPSDEGGHRHGDLPILDHAVDALQQVKIHHLGFLRTNDAFYRKARVVLQGFFNEFDKRLMPLEKESRPIWEVQDVEWTDKLVPWSGHLPDGVQRWLSERGHATPNYLPRLPEHREPPIQLSKPVSNEPVNVRTCGDLGDIIASMACLKAIGSVNLLAVDRGICKSLLPRLPLIEPLLRSQGYIKSVKVHEGEPIHWDASDFRTHHRWTQSLHQSHLTHYRSQTHLPPIKPDFRKPWITGIKADPRAKGRVLVHRTERYNNYTFPWKAIFDFYGPRILIVGTEQERGLLTGYAGEAEYMPTADLLEVAQLVAGADLVVAGQSCVLAIAEAMKRPRIAEISPSQPDVIVAISPEAQYVADGTVTLPDVAGSGTTTIMGNDPRYADVNLSVVPPGYWQLPGFAPAGHFVSFAQQVSRARDIPFDAAKQEIIEHNVKRCPKFFNPRAASPENHLYEQALENALR